MDHASKAVCLSGVCQYDPTAWDQWHAKWNAIKSTYKHLVNAKYRDEMFFRLIGKDDGRRLRLVGADWPVYHMPPNLAPRILLRLSTITYGSDPLDPEEHLQTIWLA